MRLACRLSLTQAATDGEREVRLVYYAFDLLHHDGWDISNLALIERKAILEPLLASKPGLQFNGHEIGDGEYQSPESATRARDFRIGKGLIQGGERRRFAMAVPLRADFDAVGVRCWARKSKDGPQARRLLALAAIYEGASRTEAARIGGVTLPIVRDWVLKFNADGPAGLIDRKAPGQPPRLNDAHRATLAAIIESGPIPAVHGIVRWRIVDLCQWIFAEFRVVISRQTLSRELRAMGYRKLSARPRHHAQAAGAIEDFKKVSPIAWTRSHARTASLPRR